MESYAVSHKLMHRPSFLRCDVSKGQRIRPTQCTGRSPRPLYDGKHSHGHDTAYEVTEMVVGGYCHASRPRLSPSHPYKLDEAFSGV